MSPKAQGDLFGDVGIHHVEGKNALVSMIRYYDDLQKVMGQVNVTGGATDAMLGATGNTANDMNMTWAKFNNLMTDFGDKIAPGAAKLLGVLSGWLDGINKGTPTAIGLMMGFAAAWVAVKFGLMGVNFQLGIMAGLEDMLGIGLLIAGVAALGAAIVWMWNKLEWFRGSVIGLKNAIVEILSAMFSPIGDIIEGFGMLMNGDIKGGALQIGKAMLQLNPVSTVMRIYDAKDKIAGGFKDGYAQGSQEVKDRKAADAASMDVHASVADQNKVSNALGMGNIFGGNAATAPTAVVGGGPAPTADSTVATGINDVNAGGNKVRNVYVTIQKFQDEINIHAASVKESTADMRRMIMEELVKAVSGAEQMLGAE